MKNIFTKRKKKYDLCRTSHSRITLLALLFFLVSFSTSVSIAQTTYYAGNETEFVTAYANATTGDFINITNNIVVTTEKLLGKSITIDGNGFTISVPNPGLDDMGRFNTVASSFRVFSVSGTVTVTINNLTIKGGNIIGYTGGAIFVLSGNTLYLNNCVISNSRSGNSSGGGISNSGTLYVSHSLFTRNAAYFGGGFKNNGTMYIETSTFSENRSTSLSGGGGAGENRGLLYINNSTISNNQSTEIGGGINNVTGNLYILNSSVTGNVAYGNYTGGGIGNNAGSVYAINTVFAYNYNRTGGDVSNPTSYILDDIKAFANQSNVHLYYCILHATMPVGTDNAIGNIQYTGLDDGSDNTIFSSGGLSKITDGAGTEIGTAFVFRPFLYNNGGLYTLALQTGSFLLLPANKGSQTRFAVGPAISYYDRTASSWVDLLGTSNASQLVTNDQAGDLRSNPPAIGAIEGTTEDLYMVKVNSAANGSVNGGTIYGDVYASGASVTITAIPNPGYNFVSWDYVLGGIGIASTDNPYTFIVDRDITLVPVFQAIPIGTYSVTYVGNDNTGGDAPATSTFTAPTTILGQNTLVKTGYTFNGWNTNANGSGTSYNVGDTYSASNNLILYAQWLLICINPTIGGTIAADQANCTTFDPAAFTSSVAPSGQTGTLEYKWQESTTSSNTDFSDIPGSDSETWDVASVSVTTWYKRLARVTCMSDWTGAAESNFVLITIEDNTDPTISSLSNIEETSSANTCSKSVVITDPTTSDNCTVSKLTWDMTGATVAVSPSTGINNIGTYTFYVGVTAVTYTVYDQAGNSATSSFTVTVADNVAPVPDAVSLSDLTNSCSVSIPIAPTATDNCAGVITGTTTTTFPITSSTVITWSYVDNYENITTQNQNVIITDATAPVADVEVLQDITGECSVEVSEIPSATDNCLGSILGTTTDPLYYDEQGTYTITWTYDDGNDNIITQTQTVIVEDVTNPVIVCPADVTINLAEGETTYIVPAFDLDATVTDNCTLTSLLNDNNAYYSLVGAIFHIGTTTITWTASDAAANLVSCETAVTVNPYVGISETTENNFSVYPNPTNGLTYISFENAITGTITITDEIGRVVMEKEVSSNLIELNLEGVESGIYMIQMKNAQSVSFEKIIVK